MSRELYLKQLLRQLSSQCTFALPVTGFTANITYENGTKDVIFRSEKQLIDETIDYITMLEQKCKELEYIERIINIANSDCQVIKILKI